jgi:hypothetical protein
MPFSAALAKVPRPDDGAPQGAKTAYATKLAKQVAMVLSSELRKRGVDDCMPDPVTGKGGERRMAGGIGAKKVDVSLAREDMGLVLAVSMKGIYFPDATLLRSKGKAYFAKNLVNRKGDMLAEATTLHKRFPYAVLGGIFLFDERAATDSLAGKSTYARAHDALVAFAGRQDHAGADERIEALALGLISSAGKVRLAWVGHRESEITVADFIDHVLKLVAYRNPDHFEYADGQLRRAGALKLIDEADTDEE